MYIGILVNNVGDVVHLLVIATVLRLRPRSGDPTTANGLNYVTGQ